MNCDQDAIDKNGWMASSHFPFGPIPSQSILIRRDPRWSMPFYQAVLVPGGSLYFVLTDTGWLWRCLWFRRLGTGAVGSRACLSSSHGSWMRRGNWRSDSCFPGPQCNQSGHEHIRSNQSLRLLLAAITRTDTVISFCRPWHTQSLCRDRIGLSTAWLSNTCQSHLRPKF